MHHAVVLFGRPGSGKGTVCSILKELGYAYVGTGEIFRKYASQAEHGSLIARQIGEIMRRGELVSDEQTIDMVRETLDSVVNSDCVYDGVLFDGVPRSKKQANILLDDVLPHCGLRSVSTLCLDVPRHLCAERLRGRARKAQRADDQNDIIEKRLNDFEAYGQSVLDVLADNSNIVRIDASRPIREVAALALVYLAIAHSKNSKVMRAEVVGAASVLWPQLVSV